MDHIIWRDGDAWRELTGSVLSCGAATIVSNHGTAMFVDTAAGRYRRLPLEGGKQLPEDALWLRLGSFSLTPCGVVVDGDAWHRGTAVRLVLRGLHPTWAQTDLGRSVLADVVNRRATASPGHPDQPCPAYYCRRRLTEAPPTFPA